MAADPGQKGFTLVEVLVALVVMSVGMLGIAALYLEGLRAGRTALYRTTAITLAADMADRIRANRNAGLAYAGTGPGADGDCVNGAVDCTAEELAADDWLDWSSQLDDAAPRRRLGRGRWSTRRRRRPPTPSRWPGRKSARKNPPPTR